MIEEQVNRAIGDSIKIAPNYFWIRNKVDYGKKKYSSITKEFQNFIIQAQSIIQDSHVETYPADDPIGKLILISELLQLKNIKLPADESEKNETYYDAVIDNAEKMDLTHWTKLK